MLTVVSRHQKPLVIVGIFSVGTGVDSGVGVGIVGGTSRGVGGRGIVVVCTGWDFVAVPHPALARDRTRIMIREMMMMDRMFDNLLFS